MEKTSAAKAAKRIEIADRRRRVAQLALTRVPQQEIARLLEVAPDVVCKDLAAVRAEWRDQRTAAIDELLTLELAGLNADEVRWRTKLGQASEIGVQLRIYDRLLKIHERRCKLLGLEAPVKVAATTPDGKAPYTDGLPSLDDLSEEQLMALATGRVKSPAAFAPRWRDDGDDLGE